MNNDVLRSIPPVNAIALLVSERLAGHLSVDRACALAKDIQREVRRELQRDSTVDPGGIIVSRVEALALTLDAPRLNRVLNGTGIVVHTNLGRAPVSARAADAIRLAASSAVPLEIQPDTGDRGGRMDEISTLMALLTGVERTHVVNNNAAAVLLALAALAHGKGVAVSRSEAVEIGGGFRIPAVLAQSGATLMEVGTTNRTYARDYAQAAADGAELFLKVHPSNFSVQGFVATPTLQELHDVALETGAVLVEDLGSGTLVNTEAYGIMHEPTVQETVEAGVEIVTFSGDKLMGGPQAGIICGKKQLVERIAAHPLARAVRADKTTLAGLAETLRHYARGDYETTVPVWVSIAATESSIQARAKRVADLILAANVNVSVRSSVNFVGGGSLPGQSLPGWAVVLTTDEAGGVDGLARALRHASPVAVYGRVEHDAVLIEMRTIMAEDDEALTESIIQAMGSLPA